MISRPTRRHRPQPMYLGVLLCQSKKIILATSTVMQLLRV